MPKQCKLGNLSKNISIVHVNTHIIRKNITKGENNAPICIRGKSRKSRNIIYCHDIEIIVNGEIIGGFTYNPDQPLDCGAKLWFWSDDAKVTLNPKIKEVCHDI